MPVLSYGSSSLGLYQRFSSLGFPKTYIGKFLLVAFLGVHVPLIIFCIYVAFSTYSWYEALPFVIIALFATLLGTGLTLFVQSRLLAPITQVSQALTEYTLHRTLPNLPTHFTDEAGVLMTNTQHSIEQLEQLLSMKNTLLSILSHDIRSPLTASILAMDILEEQLQSSSVNVPLMTKLLQQIRSSSQYQLGLMNSILELARAETQNIRLNIEETTATDIVEQVLSTTLLQAESKNITLSTEISPELCNLVLQVDRDKTAQVLNNLVHNAIKFTNSGGSITLRAAYTHNHVEFHVTDTGIGMDEQTQTELFKRFSKAQRHGTSGEQGAGLGLWICTTFTEAQNGTLTVQSILNQGTTFTVRLPIVVQEQNT
ncbi:MAG: HAMP domain-containing sensor histidine kinase [Bacteroidota bacterium]|nr:HAMP domain-containing histidine kinase [Candidatus Kapabacteria bacterium]MDW8219881.1 HAMP domain-containing sensor histidine kinase [Bacteroidota bacterium]